MNPAGQRVKVRMIVTTVVEKEFWVTVYGENDTLYPRTFSDEVERLAEMHEPEEGRVVYEERRVQKWSRDGKYWDD